MDLGLRGKKAIVTGATRGIGRAIVELLAQEGVDVGLCSRTEDEGDAAVHALKQRGINAVGEAVNLRDREAYKAWLAGTAAALGGCQVFVPDVTARGRLHREYTLTDHLRLPRHGPRP